MMFGIWGGVRGGGGFIGEVILGGGDIGYWAHCGGV